MEVKGLQLSSSFYFADYDQLSQVLSNKSLPESKIISRLNPTVSIFSSANSFGEQRPFPMDGGKLTQHFIL